MMSEILARAMKNIPEKPSATAMSVQETFLNYLQREAAPVTIFLVNGVKLQGVIPFYDSHAIVLRRDGHTQLVYKHAVSTIMPVAPLNLFEGEGDSAFG